MALVDAVREARPFLSDAARAAVLAAAAPYVERDPDVALECHLGAARGRVDLIVRLRPSDRDAVLASRAHEVPAAVRTFLEMWARGEDLAGMPFVELELDLDGGALRDPWVGPCIEPRIAHGIVAITRSHDGVPPSRWPSTRLAEAVVRHLGAADDAWLARVRAIFEALPPGGCIDHLTWLGARPSRAGAMAIHLIASLPGAHALGYLQRVGWRGDRDALGRLLRRHFAHATRVDLDLDVDLDGAARGTACYAAFHAPRPGDAGLARAVTALREDGLLDEAAVDALDAWIAALDPRDRRALTLKTGLRADGSPSTKLYLETRGR